MTDNEIIETLERAKISITKAQQTISSSDQARLEVALQLIQSRIDQLREDERIVENISPART